MALVVDTLKEDCQRLPTGHIKVVYNFPAEVTTEKTVVHCCGDSFCILYGMSSKTRVKYAKYVSGSVAVEDGEELEMKTAVGEARRHKCLLWMKAEFESLCDILPTSAYTAKDYHLPKCVSKISLYQQYRLEMTECEELYSDHEFQPYSKTTFYKLWKANYPYVTIPVHMAFSVCMTCAMLHDELLTATKSKDKSKLMSLKALRRTHLDFVSKERLTYRDNQRKARDQPDLYVSICIDGMDQAKLRSPHFAGGGLPKSACLFLSN